MNDRGQPLSGGNTSAVSRIGDTVHRSRGPWTESVHGLLRFLDRTSVRGVPRVLGFDEEGREVLTYLEGVVPVEEPWATYVWSERTLRDVGAWLRQYHDAVRDYRPSDDARWWYRAGAPRVDEIVCHNDLAPYNAVFVDDRLAGVIDWDVAGPGRPEWDLAFCAWSWVPLHHPELTRSLGGPGEGEQAARLTTLCDAYGHDDPVGLLQTVIERVGASADGIRTGASEGSPTMQALVRGGHLDDIERTLDYLQDRTVELWRQLGADVWEREAARVVIFDESNRLLLMSARDPGDGLLVWFTPGGSLERGETPHAAAKRELAEEIDGTATFDLRGPIWTRRHLHMFAARAIDLRESYFFTRVRASEIGGAYETGAGARFFEGWRWWTLGELGAYEGILAPSRLAELARPLLDGEIPPAPIAIGV